CGRYDALIREAFNAQMLVAVNRACLARVRSGPTGGAANSAIARSELRLLSDTHRTHLPQTARCRAGWQSLRELPYERGEPSPPPAFAAGGCRLDGRAVAAEFSVSGRTGGRRRAAQKPPVAAPARGGSWRRSGAQRREILAISE